jgi:hypothetical protein
MLKQKEKGREHNLCGRVASHGKPLDIFGDSARRQKHQCQLQIGTEGKIKESPQTKKLDCWQVWWQRGVHESS